MSAPEAAEMAARIDDLRAFEREYRARMRLYLEDRLAEVGGPDAGCLLRAAVRRIAEAPDPELREAAGGMPEPQRQRLLSALLRVPIMEVDQ